MTYTLLMPRWNSKVKAKVVKGTKLPKGAQQRWGYAISGIKTLAKARITLNWHDVPNSQRETNLKVGWTSADEPPFYPQYRKR